VGREPRVLVAEPLTASAFEVFGWVPASDTDPSDGKHRLEFAWEDPHVNVISHRPDEIEHDGPRLHCDRMFRHATHTQALLVLDNQSVVAVAPSHVDFGGDEDTSTIRAFSLKMHDMFVLHRGTWHWGPFPIGTNPVNLYNLQGFGYERDNDCVDLSGLDLWVETGEGRG
jgi:ureidoglycolate hydrolase